MKSNEILNESQIIIENFKDSVKWLRQRFKVPFRVRDHLRLEDAVGKDLAVTLNRDWSPHLVKVLNYALDKDRLDEGINPRDVVNIDIPLMIRLLEFAREDAKTDIDLHQVAGNIIELAAGGRTLGMSDYETIMRGVKTVKEAAKWRADDLGGKTWHSKDWDDRELSPGKISLGGDNDVDELKARPSAWSSKTDIAKRMTKKGQPTKAELGFQNNLKMRMKMQQKQGRLSGPKGQLPEDADNMPVSQADANTKLVQVALAVVDKLFHKNKLFAFDDLEAVKQGLRHQLNKQNVTVDTVVASILNILDRRMSKSGNYIDLSRFKQSLSQGLTHFLNKQTKVSEAGPFSYGYKQPRRGTSAHANLAKGKEVEKDYGKFEPKDNMVGTAKILSKEKVKEGYRVVPDIDRDRYTERPGLEGPFRTKSGKVVYYDPREGMYYDPDSDYYIDHESYREMNENEESFDKQVMGWVGPNKQVRESPEQVLERWTKKITENLFMRYTYNSINDDDYYVINSETKRIVSHHGSGNYGRAIASSAAEKKGPGYEFVTGMEYKRKYGHMLKD